jgi:hypothetical protein
MLQPHDAQPSAPIPSADQAAEGASSSRRRDYLGPGLEAMLSYQELLRQRLLKVTRALDAAAIPYALIGGKAVGYYVGQISQDAVRGTPNVDLLLHRADLNSEVVQELLSLEVHSPRESTRIVVAGEKVREDDLAPAPGLERVERADEGFAVIPLDALAMMKLTSFRLIDRVHLLDMIGVGLLPSDVMERLPESLRGRLQELLHNPEQ